MMLQKYLVTNPSDTFISSQGTSRFEIPPHCTEHVLEIPDTVSKEMIRRLTGQYPFLIFAKSGEPVKVEKKNVNKSSEPEQKNDSKVEVKSAETETNTKDTSNASKKEEKKQGARKMGIKATITNAAEITILAPIDANYKTGGGDINVGACLVVAEKGIPFKAMQVYGGTSSLQDQFGLPLPKKSPYMEGLRHVHDASEECSYVNAIRVVDPLTYRFPSISCLITNDRGAWNATIRYKLNDIVTYLQKQYICVYAGDTGIISSDTPNTSSDWELYEEPVKKYTNRWNATITCGSGAFAVFYVVDGDTSVNRSFKITSIDTSAERFTIEFYDKDELGEEYLLESYTVGISEDDKDDMGLSAYIETVLERNSDIFRCDFDESQTWSGLLATLQSFVGTKVSFTGGTTGDTPSTQDFITGANMINAINASTNPTMAPTISIALLIKACLLLDICMLVVSTT